jgi:hypothetical protein
MGLGSNPLFAKPANIVFVPKKLNTYLEYGNYIEDMIIPDIPISTGKFLQNIIDEYPCGIGIYGYLIKSHVNLWKCFLTDILEQNPREKKIEFHFYCGEIGLAYFMQATRKQDKIVFSIMIGSQNDAAYNDITFEDNDGNEYSTDELEDMQKKDAMKIFLEKDEDDDLEENVFANYEFDEEKYKIVYNIQGINFIENPPGIFINR